MSWRSLGGFVPLQVFKKELSVRLREKWKRYSMAIEKEKVHQFTVHSLL
jgi:hypothetical protein